MCAMAFAVHRKSLYLYRYDSVAALRGDGIAARGIARDKSRAHATKSDGIACLAPCARGAPRERRRAGPFIRRSPSPPADHYHT